MADLEGTSIYGLPARVKSSVVDLANAWMPYDDLSGDPVDTFRMSIADLLSGVTVEAQTATIVYAPSHGLTSGAIGKPIGWKADGKPYVWTDTATTEIPVAIVQAITDTDNVQIAAIGPLTEIANTLLPASLPVYSANTNSRMLFWDASAAVYKHITQGDATRDARLVYWVGLKEGDANTSVVMLLPPGVDGSARTVIANVRDFGAMQDSTTDDTAAIQAAIDSNRPLVYVPGSPDGSYYKTTNSLTLNNDNQHIYGDGPSSIIHCNANEKRVLNIAGTSATDRIENVTVSNLWLRGINATVATPDTATSLANGTGITIYYAHRVRINDCLISHCHVTGLLVSGSSSVVIENNWFFDQYWRYGLDYGTSDITIWYENENVVVRGNHCHSNADVIINAAGLQNESIEIIDNICYATDDEGNLLPIGRGPISGSSSGDSTTIGRHVLSLMYTDTLTSGTQGRCLVSGNIFRGGTWSNIYYNNDDDAHDDTGHRLIISDNILLHGAGCVGPSTFSSGAIVAQHGREVSIHDNLIIDPICLGGHGYSAGIQLWRAHDGGQVSVRGNIITNAPSDGIKISTRPHHLVICDNYIYNCGYRNFSSTGSAAIRIYETSSTIATAVEVSAINTGTDAITASGHGLTAGDRVRFTGTATTFPKFVGGVWDKQTMFWVRDVSGSDFKLSAEPYGDAIDITATFSGGTLSVLRTQFLGGSLIANNMIVDNVAQKLGAVMSIPASDVNTTTDQIYWYLHNFTGGEKVIFNNTTPANLFAVGGSTVTNDTAYFVRYVDASYFQLAETAGGAALDITSAGTGTHTMRLVCGESYYGILYALTNSNAPDIIRGNVVINRGSRLTTLITRGIVQNTANKAVVISDNYVEGYYTAIYAGSSHTTALQHDVVLQNNTIRDCYEGILADGSVASLVLIDDSNRLNSGVTWRHRTTGAYCSLFGSLRNGKIIASLPYVTAKSATITSGSDTFTSTSHGFASGNRVQLSGSIPTNFSASTNYWVRDSSTGFKLSATRTGAAITAGSTVSSGLTVTHHLPDFGTWAVGDTIVNESWTMAGTPRELVCTTAGAVGTCVFRPTQGVVTTLAASDTTPDATNAIILVTANTGATGITGFDGGAIGQRVLLFLNDSYTTLKQNAAAGSETPLYLHGWRDHSPNNGQSYEFIKSYVGTTLYWIQVSQTPQSQIATAEVNDATPSVFSLLALKTANSSATTITNFDDGWEGQQLTLFVNDANTTLDHDASGPIKLASGADEVCAVGDVFRFISVGGIWYEQTTTAAT